MNLIFRIINSAYRRINDAIQLILSPGKYYFYPGKIYLHHNLCFSQEGEDIILSRFFLDKKQGFYVDIGAHHPQRFSNTYYFYLSGWRGINIDAKPGSMDIFKQIRPNDINLEFAISDCRQTLTYYEFNEPAINGFSKEISNERDGLERYRLISKREIQTYTLQEVLDEYLPKNQEIDFLTVDVEGLDYEVLSSNNWQKYRPKLVLAEYLSASSLISTASLNEILKSKLCLFMEKQGYQLYAKSVNTLIFIRTK